MANKKLKILYVITKSTWGGAQRYVYDLATTLPREEFEIIVACGGNGALVTRLNEAGVRIIPIASFARDISITKDVWAFFELLRMFRAERPDVVHLNSSKAGGIGALAARLAGVKHCIFTVHGWAFNEPRSTFTRTLIWLAHWATALLCHTVIIISRRDLIQGTAMPLVAHKMMLIHNGIPPTKTLPREDAQQAIFGKVLPEGALAVGTIAELHPNKGLAYGLEALRSLVDSGTPVAWGIIGSGELDTTLREKTAVLDLQDHVFFAGGRDNAAQYLSAFDAFLLPSLKEGLPYVLLEAAMARLPIVATTVGGIPEIIADGTSGMLVPPRDPEHIVTALKVLARNKTLRSTAGDHAHETISQKFSFQDMLAKTKFLYLRP